MPASQRRTSYPSHTPGTPHHARRIRRSTASCSTSKAFIHISLAPHPRRYTIHIRVSECSLGGRHVEFRDCTTRRACNHARGPIWPKKKKVRHPLPCKRVSNVKQARSSMHAMIHDYETRGEMKRTPVHGKKKANQAGGPRNRVDRVVCSMRCDVVGHPCVGAPGRYWRSIGCSVRWCTSAQL
jgi:hypothetical protein